MTYRWNVERGRRNLDTSILVMINRLARSPSRMRFYQYISDSKVDMLLPQIPLKAKQKITAEIGFDIKILTAKLKTERDSLDDRVSRLLVVE